MLGSTQGTRRVWLVGPGTASSYPLRVLAWSSFFAEVELQAGTPSGSYTLRIIDGDPGLVLSNPLPITITP